MARCLRKLENDDYWIVYCNTTDVVFDYLFTSAKAGRMLIAYFESTHDLPKMMNPVSEEDMQELL